MLQCTAAGLRHPSVHHGGGGKADEREAEGEEIKPIGWDTLSDGGEKEVAAPVGADRGRDTAGVETKRHQLTHGAPYNHAPRRGEPSNEAEHASRDESVRKGQHRSQPQQRHAKRHEEGAAPQEQLPSPSINQQLPRRGMTKARVGGAT
eukprot:2651618-Prymnesium_polylepis.1